MDLWGPEKNAVGGMPCNFRFFDNHLANRKSASGSDSLEMSTFPSTKIYNNEIILFFKKCMYLYM